MTESLPVNGAPKALDSTHGFRRSLAVGNLQRRGSTSSQASQVSKHTEATKDSKNTKASRTGIGSTLAGLFRAGMSKSKTSRGLEAATAPASAAMVIKKGDMVETLFITTLRVEEDLESDVVGILKVGTVLEVKEAPGRRIQVATTKDNPCQARGWISIKTTCGEHLVARRPADNFGVGEFEVGGQHEVHSIAKIRQEEDLESAVIMDIEPGMVVQILEIGKHNTRRAKIRCKQCEGWISTHAADGAPLIGKVGDKDSKSASKGFSGNKNRIQDLLESARSGAVGVLKTVSNGSLGLRTKSSRRPDLNSSDIRGKTALMYSAAFGRLDFVEMMLDSDEVDVNMEDDTQKTALHHACKGGALADHTDAFELKQVEIVKRLIRAGATVEARDHNGCTSLMLAAANDFQKVAIILLACGANINTRDFEGHSALAYAKAFSHEVMVMMLRAGGAAPTESEAEEEDDEENAEDCQPQGNDALDAFVALKSQCTKTKEVAEQIPVWTNVLTEAADKSAKKDKAKLKAKPAAKNATAKPKAKGKAKAKASTKRKPKIADAMLEAVAAEEEAGMPPVRLELSALGEEDEKTAALRKLEVVIQSVTMPKELESVIHQCEAAGASEQELAAAYSTVRVLRERQGALGELHAAMSEKDVEALKIAIENAKTNSVAKKEIAAAAQVLKEETPKAEARKALQAAQSSCNPKDMKNAIAKCKKAGVPAEEVKEWEDMLATSQNKEKAEKGLADALQAEPLAIPDLEWAIGQAKSTGIDAAKIAKAEKILKDEKPKAVARVKIEEALESMECAKLDDAIAIAKAANLPAAEIQQCEEAKERIKKMAVSLAAVKSAVAHSMGVNMKEIDAVRREKDKLAAAITDALALGAPEANVLDAELRRKKLHNTVEDLKGSIRVFCRVRPLNKREKDMKDDMVTAQLDPFTLQVADGKGAAHKFVFDAVFCPGTQEEIFEDCKDLVQSAVDGYNVTLFAYGQTGAGKTFTMAGVPGMLGVSPRTIEEIFRVTKANSSRFSFTVLGSMLELYCQDIRDLLQKDTDPSKKLQIREQKDKTISVEHLSAAECLVAQDLHDLLDTGMKNRAVSATAMNSESSRSHLVLMIQIISVNMETKEQLKGKILIVDLAGSERLGKSKTTGQAQKESIEINKSLTCLGNVIEALTRPKKGVQSIPYRDSNLTLVMKDALGGTAKTLMFVNCSPAKDNTDETLNSLKYARRAKMVENTPDIKTSKSGRSNKSNNV